MFLSVVQGNKCKVPGGVTSELVSSVSLYTSGDCDDGVSGKYVDTVKQFMGITVSLELVPQHILSSCAEVQLAQLPALLLNVILMTGVSVSFTLTMHQLTLPAVL